MKIINKYSLIIFSGLVLLFTACQEDDYELGPITAPTNVEVNYSILGADDQNPYGDGSGIVSFSTSSNGAITYTYDYGDATNTETAASGKSTHLFSKTGVNKYTVTVSAVGPGGMTTLKVVQLEVFSSFEDAEAVDLLTGGSAKKWYWAADQPGHAGLGPVSDDYGNGEFGYAAWWSIGSFDAEKSCMYDAEFEFTKSDNGVTFEQKLGPAWIPGTYAGDLGIDGDVCIDETVALDIFGVKNVSFSPSTSKAATEANYRGTSFTISDGGFMGWWVGTHAYDIIEISDNVLKVRIIEDEANAWYHIFTDVKP